VADERRGRVSKTVSPTAPEVERSALSLMLQYPSARAVCAEALDEDDFSVDAHRVIFGALKKMADANEPVDVMLAADRLKSEGLLDRAGGVTALAEIQGWEASEFATEGYVRKLKEKSLTRKLIGVGTWMSEEGYKPGLAPYEYAEEAERLLFETVHKSSRKGAEPLDTILQKVVNKVSDLTENRREFTGVPSGFYDLDDMLFGFQKSDLLILAARPAMGKTSLALNFLLEAGNRGHKAAFFSLEMPKEQLAMRLLAVESGVDLFKIMRGRLQADELSEVVARAGAMRNLPIYIDDTPALTVNGLMSRSRRLASEYGLELIMVDYLQLMRGSAQTNSREQEISEISRSLKALAKELEIPVIALSQLNRSLESRKDRRPMLSDLRESGAIEQDADIVLFIYRDEIYDENTKEKGVAEIIVAKHRNGATGTAKLGFEGEKTRFYNRVEDDSFAS
jgi:replicative DNA helicase